MNVSLAARRLLLHPGEVVAGEEDEVEVGELLEDHRLDGRGAGVHFLQLKKTTMRNVVDVEPGTAALMAQIGYSTTYAIPGSTIGAQNYRHLLKTSKMKNGCAIFAPNSSGAYCPIPGCLLPHKT